MGLEYWNLVVCASVQQAAGVPLPETAPLFEKEADRVLAALVAKGTHPIRVHWPASDATFAAYDDLLDFPGPKPRGQIERSQERFAGQPYRVAANS